jgi:hypothetical protein
VTAPLRPSLLLDHKLSLLIRVRKRNHFTNLKIPNQKRRNATIATMEDCVTKRLANK